MARHADLLHSVVLDSAYPVRDLDPWYGSSGVTARNAMDAVCARDAACAAAAPGSASARIAELLGALRRGPITGPTRDADGSRVQARVDVRALVDMVQDAGSDPVIYRELDASVRAALAGDRAPLLRLAAQSQTYDHGTSPAGLLLRRALHGGRLRGLPAALLDARDAGAAPPAVRGRGAVGARRPTSRPSASASG